jgi:hypothetical protein
MYWELRQIGANFRAYHKFDRSPDTQYISISVIFGFLPRHPDINTFKAYIKLAESILTLIVLDLLSPFGY